MRSSGGESQPGIESRCSISATAESGVAHRRVNRGKVLQHGGSIDCILGDGQQADLHGAACGGDIDTAVSHGGRRELHEGADCVRAPGLRRC